MTFLFVHSDLIPQEVRQYECAMVDNKLTSINHFQCKKSLRLIRYTIWHSAELREGTTLGHWIMVQVSLTAGIFVSLIRPRQLSRYCDSLRAGRSGDRIPVGARFSAPVQTGPGAYPASCTMVTGSFPVLKEAGPWC